MIDPVAGKRVVILTGCSSGIGLQTALLFLKHEYKVFGLDINQFDTAHLEKLEGGKFTENFYCHQANLLEDGAIEKAVAACLERFGEIDVLVYIEIHFSMEPFLTPTLGKQRRHHGLLHRSPQLQ